MAKRREPKQASQDHATRMREAVRRFMMAADGDEAIAAVEAFPELLSVQGERVAAGTAATLRGQVEPEFADHLDAQVELLRRARVVGMDRALFDKMMEPFQAHVDAAEEALQGFLATGNGELLKEAATVWRAIVAHEYLPFNGVEYEHWALGRTADAVLHQHRRTGDGAFLDEAVTLLERAAALEGVPPQRRLPRLLDLGNALMVRHGVRGQRADRDRAVTVLSAAASVTRPGSPAYRQVMAALSAAQRG